MAAEFDLIIRGGTVVDGTGSAPIEADVGIKGNRIAAIGTSRRTAQTKSTRKASWSRRASSISIRTMTARRCGTAA